MNNKSRYFCKKKKENWQHYRQFIYDDIDTPIVLIMGPNGTGKTMSLRSIEVDCNNQNIKVLRYGKKDDIVDTNVNFDIEKFISAFKSEGERMNDSFDNWCHRKLLRELLTNEENLVVLFDELDSGLSPDRLRYIIDQLVNIQSMEKDKHPNRIFQYVFTCNSFEMYELLVIESWCKTLWTVDGRCIDFRMNYQDFKKKYYEYGDVIFKEEKE